MAVILIERVRGDAASREEVDDSRLIRVDGLIDNDVEYTTTVEYCFLDCPGQAHRTLINDAPGHLCNFHVHRSASIYLKQGLAGVGDLGKFL